SSIYFIIYRIFFFSSRRRHTRSKRDWSSDVCSSDLRPPARHRGLRRRGGPRRAAPAGVRLRPPRVRRRDDDRRGPAGQSRLTGRSEERRVGKESRSMGTVSGGQEATETI